jgi:putative Mn2+ efflux pump MntP
MFIFAPENQIMAFITLLLIAVGLSFDTFAVSISSGLILSKITFKQATRIGITFALFQASMPVIGWLVGESIKQYAQDFDHWIAFIILGALGAKMIIESRKSNPEERNLNPLDFKVMIGMAVATSIDALIVGFSFALLEVNIFWAAIIIGAITYLVAMLGMLFGKNIGSATGRRMEMLGGILLILLGLKILVEHLGYF